MAWQLEPQETWVLEPEAQNLASGPHTNEPLEPSPPSMADINKQLEDRALVGQRAYEGMMNLGQMSQDYRGPGEYSLTPAGYSQVMPEELSPQAHEPVPEPTLWDKMLNRYKTAAQVTGGLAHGAVTFPFSTALKGSELIASKFKGETPEQLNARMEAVNKAFQPPVGELTPDAQKAMEIIGYPFSLPAKAGGAVAAAVGGEGWRPAGEIAGDVLLMVLPAAMHKMAGYYVDKGMTGNLTKLILNNNKIGLSAEESAAMASNLVDQASAMKGRPLTIAEKWRAGRGFSRMEENLAATRGAETPEPPIPPERPALPIPEAVESVPRTVPINREVPFEQPPRPEIRGVGGPGTVETIGQVPMEGPPGFVPSKIAEVPSEIPRLVPDEPPGAHRTNDLVQRQVNTPLTVSAAQGDNIPMVKLPGTGDIAPQKTQEPGGIMDVMDKEPDLPKSEGHLYHYTPIRNLENIRKNGLGGKQQALENRSPPGADVPFMLTNEMKASLKAKGLTDEQISNLKPGEAQNIIGLHAGLHPGETIRALREIARKPVEGIKSLVLPASLSKEHLKAAGEFGAELGTMNRRLESATQRFRKDSKLFDRMGVFNKDIPLAENPGVKFASDVSVGRETAPELRASQNKVKMLFESGLRDLAAAGAPIENARDEYFPGMWKDKAKAAQFLAKRTFPGGESFRKQKYYQDTMDAIKAGLEPISPNPIDLALLQYAGVERAALLNRVMMKWKETGDVRFLKSGLRMPEGFSEIKSKMATVYGPPEMLTTEYVDKNIYNALSKTAENLGIRHERVAAVGGGLLGKSYTGANRIETKANTELGVMAHEIGHQLDRKYDLWDRMVKQAEGIGKKGEVTKSASAKARAEIQDELRAIADLKLEFSPNASNYYKKYTRKKSEKIAQFIELYAQDSERFVNIAPKLSASFETFLGSIPELKPLQDIQGGISYQELQTKKNIGGFPVIGQWIAKKPAADILNNYSSGSLYNNPYFGGLYKGTMAVGNLMNQAQLGMGSAFHAGFTSAEVTISQSAMALKNAYGVIKGNRSLGALATSLGRIPGAFIMTPLKGSKLLSEWRDPGSTGDPHMAEAAKAAELAGARFSMEKGLRTNQTQAMARDWYAGDKVKAAARSPVAFAELLAKPIMDGLVPRQKAGVFLHLFDQLREMNPNVPLEELIPELRQKWNRVDARLGQVSYERLFMNNAAKNTIQAIVRAPGWSGGTIAEVGGSIKDAKAFITDWIKTGKMPKEMPDRVAYTISLLLGTALANGVLTWLFTGDTPQGVDYWAFRDGGKDERGKPTRLVLPTYAKDIFSFFKDAPHTLLAKTHPLWGMVSDWVRNKDYYNVVIRNTDDPWQYQVGDLAKDAAKRFTPFWIKGTMKTSETSGGLANTLATNPMKLLAPQIGVMPATSAYTKTEAEKKISEIQGAKAPIGGKTHEQALKSELKRKVELAVNNKTELSKEDKALIRTHVAQKEIEGWFEELITEPAGQRSFNHLTLPEAVKVYKMATPEEKRLWFQPLYHKFQNEMKAVNTGRKMPTMLPVYE